MYFANYDHQLPASQRPGLSVVSLPAKDDSIEDEKNERADDREDPFTLDHPRKEPADSQPYQRTSHADECGYKDPTRITSGKNQFGDNTNDESEDGHTNQAQHNTILSMTEEIISKQLRDDQASTP